MKQIRMLGKERKKDRKRVSDRETARLKRQNKRKRKRKSGEKTKNFRLRDRHRKGVHASSLATIRLYTHIQTLLVYTYTREFTESETPNVFYLPCLGSGGEAELKCS